MGNFGALEPRRERFGSARGRLLLSGPYEPLQICNGEAIELIATADNGLLDAAFSLFKKELISIYPDYFSELNLADLALEDFCESCFTVRVKAAMFVWAEQNLREAERNYADELTILWQYSILKMHETIALIVPHLDDDDFSASRSTLSRCSWTSTRPFNKRMLALHDAGKLDIIAVGASRKINSHAEQVGAVLHWGGKRGSNLMLSSKRSDSDP